MLEVIETVKRVAGADFKVEIAPRRAGDPAVLIASSSRIERELEWHPRFQQIDQIVASAWDWMRSSETGAA